VKKKNVFDLTFLEEVKKIERERELFAKQALRHAAPIFQCFSSLE
jgi:hypothetical protein